MAEEINAHTWRFFRAGGFDQVRLDSGADLLALDQLDQKLWVALACPVAGIDFDDRTLSMLDANKDGRIRALDILEAVRWLRSILKDPEELVRPGVDLSLDCLDETSPEGARVLASARRILQNLGKPEASSITLAEAQDTGHIFAQTHFNGDGVVPPQATEDETLKALIADIIACQGGVPDRSGELGVDQSQVEAFFADIAAFGAWLEAGAEVERTGCLSGEMGVAAAALDAVREKIDGFFLRCRLAAYSDGAAQSVNPGADLFGPLATMGVDESLAVLRPLPLAAVSPGAALPLGEGINPAWEAAIEAFRHLVITPLIGARDHLEAEEWSEIKDRFAAYAAWQAAKPAVGVERLGEDRVLALHRQDHKAEILDLIAQDKALEAEAAAIDAVERALVLRVHLLTLVNNFVCFRDFYTRSDKAMFQAGTLFLDGRSADLCLRVDDVAKHATLATLSRIFLVYCDCVRRGSGEKMTIVAGFTAGDSDRLMVGRNGVFYDRKGRDWDATIVRIIEHPISMRQAIWSPYKQLVRLIGAQVEKISAARARAQEMEMQARVVAASQRPVGGPASAAAKAPDPAAGGGFDIGRSAGIFAALGLAVGAIGTAVASVVTGFLHLTWWQMPLALLGLISLVSGPSVIIAFMKLRQRSLAPILDATGWAVNARATINIPFGGSLTQVSHLPPGAVRSVDDPFAEKSRPWGLYLLLLGGLAVAAFAMWRTGFLHQLLR